MCEFLTGAVRRLTEHAWTEYPYFSLEPISILDAKLATTYDWLGRVKENQVEGWEGVLGQAMVELCSLALESSSSGFPMRILDFKDLSLLYIGALHLNGHGFPLEYCIYIDSPKAHVFA